MCICVGTLSDGLFARERGLGCRREVTVCKVGCSLETIHISLSICVYIYIYTYTHVYIYIYIALCIHPQDMIQTGSNKDCSPDWGPQKTKTSYLLPETNKLELLTEANNN